MLFLVPSNTDFLFRRLRSQTEVEQLNNWLRSMGVFPVAKVTGPKKDDPRKFVLMNAYRKEDSSKITEAIINVLQGRVPPTTTSNHRRSPLPEFFTVQSLPGYPGHLDMYSEDPADVVYELGAFQGFQSWVAEQPESGLIKTLVNGEVVYYPFYPVSRKDEFVRELEENMLGV